MTSEVKRNALASGALPHTHPGEGVPRPQTSFHVPVTKNNLGYAPEEGSGFKLLKWESEKLMENDPLTINWHV